MVEGARVFVINLARSVDRRRAVAATLEKHQIPFHFIDGVDGVEGTHPLLARFNSRKFLTRHGRYAVPGEAGCYASHFLAWQKAVECGHPIVVLEDDFDLADNAREAFDTAVLLAQQFPFIRLEGNTWKPSVRVAAVHPFIVRRFLKIPQRATGYVLSPWAATALIAASDEFVYPVDVFIRYQHLHRVPVYGLTPAAVISRTASAKKSVIGNRHSRARPLSARLTRLGFKVSHALQNVVQNLRLLPQDIRHIVLRPVRH